MATVTSMTGAERLPDGDYSVAHRAPPPVPTDSSSSPAHAVQAPPSSASASTGGRRDRQQHGKSDSASVSTSAGRDERPHRRRGSFGSFLRRSSSHASQGRAADPSTTASPADLPPLPLPKTRFAQAQQEAAKPIAGLDGRDNRVGGNLGPAGNRVVTTEGRTMLRKASRQRRERELALQEAERARLERMQRPPPRLPSTNPLPAIDSFGGDDAVAPSPPQQRQQNHFHHPQHHQHQHTLSSTPARPANAPNFSRPAHAMPPSSHSDHNAHSSSPAYAVRSGNAFPPHDAVPPPNLRAAAEGGPPHGEYAVPNTAGHTESMTHRGRYSYASSVNATNVNSPRRIRRRKDPTPFNVLVVGAKNSGKTSLISFLRHSLALPANKQPSSEPDATVNVSTSAFTSHYLETEIDGERMGLTLWDSVGLEKNIVDLQLREMATFVESKFEETFLEEQKVMRSPGVKDTHIHCVFLVLDPIRLDATVAASSARMNGGGGANVGGLDDALDLQVPRALWGKTTVIPVISKADTLTSGHMSFLKRAVWESIKAAKVDPLEALELEDDTDGTDDDDKAVADTDDDDDEFADARSRSDVIDNLADKSDSSDDTKRAAPKPTRAHHRQSSLTLNSIKSHDGDDMPYIPMSILSPDPYDLPPYVSRSKANKQIGRRFPWGMADPYNAEHCDFTRLRASIFSEWRSALRDLSRDKWYENWRTSRLKNLPGSKQRVKGGVTPVAAVPREGRTGPQANRSASALNPASAAVPRSVSDGNVAVNGSGAPGSPTNGNKSLGGAYRGMQTYQ